MGFLSNLFGNSNSHKCSKPLESSSYLSLPQEVKDKFDNLIEYMESMGGKHHLDFGLEIEPYAYEVMFNNFLICWDGKKSDFNGFLVYDVMGNPQKHKKVSLKELDQLFEKGFLEVDSSWSI